jgi:membrane protein implicated in regulation of membrane protease activity
MNWPQIFLGCFVVGFALSVMSFALGAVHAHLHIHVPWGHHVHGHVFHTDHAGADAVSPINFATIMAFLAWFGGTGFLLTTTFGWLAVPALGASTVVGLIGAAIVFWMMARVLWSPHENMKSADYHMVGVHGRLTQPIRTGGIGELVYSRAGARQSCGAKSDDGGAIERGVEVIVTDYTRGVASVRRWTDFETDSDC